MINLFNLRNSIVDTSQFNHRLHGSIVHQFEEKIAEYCGAQHAVTFCSATCAIETIFRYLYPQREVKIPSLIPHVVANALTHAGKKVVFTDDVKWVGGRYDFGLETSMRIIDAAHEVDRDMLESPLATPYDMIILSHFPTKPVGGFDGGTVLFNSKNNVDFLREMSMNGEQQGINSWDRKFNYAGHKYYMNSFQAHIALQSLRELDEKKERLYDLRCRYNEAFGLWNTSNHLYRVPVNDNRKFIEKAKEAGIICGIHYSALHQHPLFATHQCLPFSEQAARTMVSIPFHEGLTAREITTVIDFVLKNKDL